MISLIGVSPNQRMNATMEDCVWLFVLQNSTIEQGFDALITARYLNGSNSVGQLEYTRSITMNSQ
jgi:hypothetical protein